ncbi:MAG TPA: ROK family protein [Erysipelothrix sp.]
MTYLAIDIGGTTIQYGLITKDFKMQKSYSVPTPTVATDDQFYAYLLAHAPQSPYQAVGIAVPGTVIDGTIVTKGSERVYPLFQSPIIAKLETRFKKPVAALNDAKAAGLCELYLGAAKGSNSSACFIIGTAVGGALTYKDDLIFGHDGCAGEFSSVPIMMDDKLVSLAWIASATALMEFYNEASGENVTEAKPVFTAYHAQDPIAIAVMERWISYIVVGLVQISSIYNPEVICIGGGVSQDPSLVTLIEQAYRNRIQAMFNHQVFTPKIVACEYRNHANLYGAIAHLLKTI